ncbi:MAG: hypothetical protein OEZ02_08835, partial [Anaerolineae bacterium]|nr:hypothetical protein [Anaerolineae bacterium]
FLPAKKNSHSLYGLWEFFLAGILPASLSAAVGMLAAPGVTLNRNQGFNVVQVWKSYQQGMFSFKNGGWLCHPL